MSSDPEEGTTAVTQATLPLEGRIIVTGVPGDDIHVMGIRLVEHALKSAGAKVVSLGVMTPISEFVEAAVETAADAVVLSSSNGHAAIFCDGIRDAFTEAGLGQIGLYIGGNLRVGSRTAYEDVEEEFARMGFDRTFPPNADLVSAMQLLADDLCTRDPKEA